MTLENFQIDSAAITDKGLSEKRPQNEDSYLELRDSGLYAVADGVGGAQAGDVASQMAIEILGEAFINLREDGDAEERMKAAIRQANTAIFQMANELAQLSTMATTIVAVHINGNIATIGHVGDSRLYRLDEAGNLYRETQDHSVVEEEVRAGRMTPEQALTHPSRNVISRALGAEHNVEIDMKTIMFEPGTKFLVCSDGVTRHIPDEELRSLLVNQEDSFTTCQTIKRLCYERGALDNLTAVVIAISGEGESKFDESSETIDDFEADTIAAARPALANNNVFGNLNEISEVIPGDPQEIPDDSDTDELLEERNQDDGGGIEIPINQQNDSVDKMSFESNSEDSKEDSQDIVKKDIKSYRVEEKSGLGWVGSILSGILWLLIGGVIGVLGYHYWSNNFNQPVNLEATVAVDKQLLDYESDRRAVDQNPDVYLSVNVNPKQAQDHYLIGRAHLLTGNAEAAKISLEKAQELLTEADPVNKKVLENDIAIALANIAEGKTKIEVKSPGVEESKPANKSVPETDEPLSQTEDAGQPLSNNN